MFRLFEIPVSGSGIRTTSMQQQRSKHQPRLADVGTDHKDYGMTATTTTTTAIRRNEASMTIRFA